MATSLGGRDSRALTRYSERFVWLWKADCVDELCHHHDESEVINTKPPQHNKIVSKRFSNGPNARKQAMVISHTLVWTTPEGIKGLNEKNRVFDRIKKTMTRSRSGSSLTDACGYSRAPIHNSKHTEAVSSAS